MSSVVRLNSGDIIQVREGVLQGIGPQGPTGPSGPTGEQGTIGPQGVPGPMGQVDDFYSQVHNVGNPQSVASQVDTLISFPTTVVDQAQILTSLTAFSLPVGLWQICANLGFWKPGASNASGWRRCSVIYDGQEILQDIRAAVADVDTWVSLVAYIPVTTPGKLLQLRVRHSDSVSIALSGKAIVSRVGPGAQGEAGAQGIQGVAGPVGPTGPIGPPGSLVSNSTTFADIGG